MKKIFPPDAYEIGRILLIIGQYYRHFNNLPLAFEYYKHVLTIYKQVLSESDHECEEVKTDMKKLQKALNS